MKQTMACIKCNCRRILIIDEVHTTVDDALNLYAGRNPFLLEGKFQVMICSRCGYTEWYAYELDRLLPKISQLYPRVRIVDGEGSAGPYR